MSAVRGDLTAAGFTEPTVTEYAQEGVDVKNRFMVHLGEVSQGSVTDEKAPDNSVAARVQQTLGKLVTAAENVEIEKVDMVGPTVGRQLKLDAVKAMFWALVFIVAYLWFRFELKFSVGAVVALIDDLAITLGLFALTGRQISPALSLPCLRLSGTDELTRLIVFDRVREDMKLYRGRGMGFMEILDRSINQTLSRTILTSTLTLAVVLLIWGGETINDFAFALTCGIVVGTYSSIFIASPVVHYWQLATAKWSKRKASGDDDNTPSRYRRKSTKSGANVEDEASAT